MLAIIGAVLLIIGFIIHAAGISTDRVFSVLSFELVGLALVALHLAGIGSGWKWRR
jgi:hypothetical protein